jgi:hypothetical protein
VTPRTYRTGALVIVAAIAAAACNDRAPNLGGTDGGTDAEPVCEVPAPTACPEPPVRYSDVSSIFTQRCVPCHYGAVNGPWPLLTYSHAADWYDLIRSYMLDCSMPPPGSGITMTVDERVALLTWILCGVPE